MATNTATEKLIEPYVDLGTLLLIDRDPIDTLPDIGGAEQLAELTRKNAQFLFNKIWTLPRKVVQDATCAQLPVPQYALPREKPIPKPREPTKWERFAKAKGIVKQKPQSNKVWDETTEDWKPRWGYNKANDETKDWLIEIPDQADPYKDYFAERSAAKRERVSKQEMQRLRNVANAEKAATGGGGGGNNQNSHPQPQMGPTANFAGGQEVGAVHGTKKQPMKREMKEEQEQFGGHNNNNMMLKTGSGGGGKRRQQLLGDGKPLGLGPVDTKSGEQLTHQLDRAKKATASLGKFQPALKGEKRPRGTGIKRKFEPNESDGTEERKRQMDILARLQAKKQKLTTTAAVTPSRLNSVNEHIRREEKRSSDGGGQSSADGGSDRPERKKLGKAGRSKSQIDRQQHFQRGQKRARKSGFHGGRSKAGKATAGRHSGSSGGGGGGGGGKGRRK